MKNKNFLKIGLLSICLNYPFNIINAKENLYYKPNITSEKKLIVEDSFFSNNKLKTLGFISLGVLGLGSLGVGYFFIRLVNAGKPIIRTAKQQYEESFTTACLYGDLNQIKYLLNEKNVNIHYEKDLGIIRACHWNHLEVVKYLLTSPELKNHSSIHADKDLAFKSAYKKKNIEIVKYLIFEYKIQITKNIKEFIKDNEELQQMFDKRELKDKLENKLPNKKDTIRKNKL